MVEGDSTRPVAGAVVMLSAAPAGLAAMSGGESIPLDQLMNLNVSNLIGGMRQAIADSQGRFAFTGLAAGSFSLAATKPGWTGGAYGQRRPDGTPMPLVLTGGDRLGSVVLQLWKNASLGGLVVDEAGEPIVGLGVRALRRSWIGGRPRYAMAGAAQTDDRGLYRIAGLRPGEYIVVVPQTPSTAPASGGQAPMNPAVLQGMLAAGGPGGDPNAMMAAMMALMGGGGGPAGIRVGDWVLQTFSPGSRLIPPAFGDAGAMSAYRTTFFPNATASAQATPVTLASGQDYSGVDFQLRPVPVVQVSGVIVRPESGQPRAVAVRLVPAADETVSESGVDGAAATTTPDGAFAFLAVPPGQYTIRVVQAPPQAPSAAAAAATLAASASTLQNAQGNRTISMSPMTVDMMLPAPAPIPAEPTLWASMPVAIADRDLSGISVPLRAAFRISGTVQFDGAAQPPAADRLRRVPIVIERADSGTPTVPLGPMGASSAGQIDDNGRFTTPGLVPGRYFIRAPFALSGWTFKSAMLAGRDLSDEPIEIENADISGVVLTFTDRITELTGGVRDSQGRFAAGASVVVFTPLRDRWVDFGSNPRRLRVARTSADGRFRLTGLPGGDYLVAASAIDIAADWQNPAVLEALSRTATRITIADGERKAVELVAR